MSHLRRFRIGWENENLAQFILSKISFISNPVSFGDDIGNDLFCTLYTVEEEGNTEILIPHNSFAIQVKSKNSTAVDFKDKRDFLLSLELPFFLGIIDQSQFKISVYSGELLPIAFSEIKINRDLKLHLVDDIPEGVKDTYWNEKNYTHIKFPFLLDMKIDESKSDLKRKTNELMKLCSLMQENISSRNRGRYIFKTRLFKQYVYIVAGKDSFQNYNQLLIEQLAETLYNIDWGYNHFGILEQKEVDAIRSFIDELKDLSKYQEFLPFAEQFLEELLTKFNSGEKNST